MLNTCPISRFLIVLPLVCCLACTKNEREGENTESQEFKASILSASVGFKYTGQILQDFFPNPKLAYVSGYFYFEEDLADDIIFGLDIELLEGLENPQRFEGADWMALAGFNRNGILWFPIGSPENRQGTPTNTDLWETVDFGVTLLPNTWYKMTIVCDYDSLEFVSVSLIGQNIDKTESLAGYPLEYPNYAPFDKASLTAYTFALRGLEFASDLEAGFDVYFDDIQMGVWSGNDFEPVFSDGFEQQNTVPQLPFKAVPLSIDQVNEVRWYLENEEAKLSIISAIKHSGEHSLKCSADLRK